MANKVVEKVYGRDCIYEIRRSDGRILSSDSFLIYKVGRSGEKYIGSFRSLADAVSKAKALG